MAAFSQIYCEKWKQKAEPNDFKSLQFGKKSICKTGTKEVLLVEEILTLKEMLRTLHRDNKKDP